MAQHRVKYEGVNDDDEGTYGVGWASPLDWQRCAGLHNHIIARATPHNHHRAAREAWWEIYGTDTYNTEDEIATKFHPNVLEFLKHAQVPRGNMCPDFFWNIDGIPPPNSLFSNGLNEAYRGLETLDQEGLGEDDTGEYLTDGYGDDSDAEMVDDDEEALFQAEIALRKAQVSTEDSVPCEEDGNEPVTSPLDWDQHRFITLYTTPDTSEDGEAVGLVYDQKRQYATFIADKADIPAALGKKSRWRPLEMILDAWHGLIDRGKVVASENGHWKMIQYTKRDLEEALQTWHQLLEAIEAKRRSKADGGDLPRASETNTLLDPGFSEAPSIPEFWRKFLTQARRSTFDFIAPGLRNPSCDELAQRIAASLQHEGGHFPLLLFAVHAEANPVYLSSITQQVNLTDPTVDETLFPHAKGLRANHSFAPGLYLLFTGPLEMNPYADAFRLILPFPVGSNGSLHFDELVDRDRPGQAYGTVYQQLRDTYGGGVGGHDTKLPRLFTSWKNLIEREQGWVVGRNGVGGKGDTGIGQFADADVPGPCVFYM